MKKYIYILLATVIFSSCESELELFSPSELTAAGFWNTETGAKAGHTGLYGTLRGSNSALWMLGELRSDIWGGVTFESPSNVSFIESNFNATTAPFGAWGGFYTRLHRLNDFIINVPKVDFVNESEKNHLLGQAYGLRAFYYYTLTKTWGDVPIVLEPLTTVDPSNLGKARSPEAEVMTLIKSDIEESLRLFGSDNSFWLGSRVYWSKAATLALKGDVYIWSGNVLGGGNADFTAAKTALQQIASMGITLESSYENLWGSGNENNNEFIFAIQYKENEATNFFNSMVGRSTEIYPNFDDKGNSMNGATVGGANRYGPSEKTLVLLDDNDDSRKATNFIYLYSNDNDGAGYPNYDAANYFGAIFNKFLGDEDGTGGRIFESDTPIYRYADVLLLLAEAKNHLGEDPSGEINQIRARAYGDNYVSATHGYINGSKVDNANAILEERYKEFIGEGKRWWDLRRAGDSFVYDNNDYISSSKSYLLKLPITVDMIGRNPLLEQTEGYN
ncbi:RagB/SusD family nutrient uptake outer membrane protein [Lutibacter sp.]|uniref:RagB/SusD family nutrient uptake outer membrane protein n=1 Tax=Lutibacter sp. TaxID=1925666 RepID=UPI0035670048